LAPLLARITAALKPDGKQTYSTMQSGYRNIKKEMALATGSIESRERKMGNFSDS